MSNVSIKLAFERMWHHIVTALNGKSDTDHTHSEFYSKSETESYVTNAVNTAKNDLLNGAGEAYDTLKELSDLINENTNALEALETVATNKLDKTSFAEHLTETELFLSSANGKKFKFTIDDSGTLTIAEIVVEEAN